MICEECGQEITIFDPYVKDGTKLYHAEIYDSDEDGNEIKVRESCYHK